MVEMIIRVPDENFEMLIAIMEKFGVEIVEIKNKKKEVNKKESKVKLRSEVTKKDHTYLFNKPKDVDINVKKSRD